jgi:lysyl-tRNA synthetase class II
VFYDIKSGTVNDGTEEKIQVMSSLQNFGDPAKFQFLHGNLKLGDYIGSDQRCESLSHSSGVEGFAGKTNIGELTIFPKTIALLAPCVHQVSFKYAVKQQVFASWVSIKHCRN